MTGREVGMWYWLVDKLPNKLVYFCFMKIWNLSTSGDNSNKIPEKMTCSAAITYFSKDNDIEF